METEIEKAIEQVVIKLGKNNIEASINLENIPEEERRAGEFTPCIRFFGRFSYGEYGTEYNFWVGFPISTHKNVENWTWVIAHEFLSRAFSHLVKSGTDSKFHKTFNKLTVDIIDDLIKQTII